jgi:hypothetical protein
MGMIGVEDRRNTARVFRAAVADQGDRADAVSFAGNWRGGAKLEAAHPDGRHPPSANRLLDSGSGCGRILLSVR